MWPEGLNMRQRERVCDTTDRLGSMTGEDDNQEGTFPYGLGVVGYLVETGAGIGGGGVGTNEM